MRLALLVLLFSLTAGVSAQAQTQLAARDGGGAFVIPDRFMVRPDGIHYVMEGRPATAVKWDEINLGSLAKSHPQIEQARQVAVLQKRTSYFTPRPTGAAVLKAFMRSPIDVQFQRRVETRSTTVSRYNVSLTGYADGSAVGVVQGSSSTIAMSIDRTRFPLATTIEGLLMTIGDDRNSDSSRLIRELQKQNGFFQNLLIGFRNLQDEFPNHTGISDSVKSLDLFAAGSVSIDAQRQLFKFAQYCRTLK